MAPWIPPIVEFLEAVFEFLSVIAPIASAVASIILAYLYFAQSQTLEEQRKLSRANQCPYLTGPYNINHDPDEDVIHMHVSNSGNGAAVKVELKTELRLSGISEDMLRGGVANLGSTRVNTGDVTQTDIQPGESNVRITIDADRIMVGVMDESRFRREASLPIQSALPILREHDVILAHINFHLTYTDKFGENMDPFGREYISDGKNIHFLPDETDLPDIYDHLSTRETITNRVWDET